ncbi:MAG: hypothetical protein K9H64_10615 [Bacteroidales bacterium]|nr:hypothetical protein [Bacteroidales bacterium]MCF8456312.1 hypothetical protein [Bacteroidales bacterium]
MYNFISLKVKCPKCRESLLDPQRKIDNVPGIKLLVSCNDQKGSIWLSSIYGSYNYMTDIEIPEGTIAEFSCPHCKEEITGKASCEICEAPMVPLNLEMGGYVRFCSRSGCTDHNVEFADLSVALKKLYQEYGYTGKGLERKETLPRSENLVEKKVDEVAEIIDSGTFLQAYCPHCNKSLIEDEMLKLKIVNGKEGFLMLSPYMNTFSSKSTIYLPEDTVVKDIKCNHCNTSLIANDKSCKTCGSSVAKIHISARTKLIAFYICMKKGCKWHGLNEDDYFNIKLEDSLEW